MLDQPISKNERMFHYVYSHTLSFRFGACEIKFGLHCFDAPSCACERNADRCATALIQKWRSMQPLSSFKARDRAE